MSQIYWYKLQRKRKLDDLTSSLEDVKNRKQVLSESVAKAKVGKEESVSAKSQSKSCVPK